MSAWTKGTKDVDLLNDAGQIIHIGDPARQAQYTMNLYYRNPGAGPAKPEEAPPGTP